MIEILTIVGLVVSLVALIVAWISMRVSSRAYRLALFDKRYDFYQRFLLLLNKVVKSDRSNFYDALNETKHLLWEARYIFGDDVCKLLESMQANLKSLHASSHLSESEYKESCKEYRVGLMNIVISLVGEGQGEGYGIFELFDKYLCREDLTQPI